MYDTFIMQLYYLWLDIETFFVGFWTLLTDYSLTGAIQLITTDMGDVGDVIQWVIDEVLNAIQINGVSIGSLTIIELLFSGGLFFVVILILAKFFISVFK